MQTGHLKALIDSALTSNRFDLAEQLLRALLIPDRETAQALLLAADIRRARGDLLASLEALQRVPASAPGHARAAALAAILGQRAVLTPPDEIAPVPFATTSGVLSPVELVRLREFAIANQASFRPARVKAAGKIDKLTSSARTWQGVPSLPIAMQERVSAAVQANAARLGIERTLPEKYELEISAYGDGDFILPHWDRGDGITSGRRLTSLFYFHADPPRFSGGELRLHDTGPAGSYDHARWTTIHPASNTLLQFKAEAIHAVTPVTGPTDFADSRFCLTFWAWE